MTTLNELRSQADEIAAAGHAGLGNTMRDAADEIDRLRTEAVAADIRIENDALVIAGLAAERDALRAALAERDAKLAALEKQEPVAEVLLVNGEKTIDASMAFFDKSPIGTKLYAAAGAAPVPIEYTPGKWFKAQGLDQMQEFYRSRLPAIREAAREHGYAIGVHGSERRDFDLIAMQWREGASDRDTLAEAIQVAACGLGLNGKRQWEQKPSGRVATSMPICWTDYQKDGAGHIDLSLITAAGAAPEPDMLAGWIRACYDEMISAHLGVANLSDSYESAKAKLNELISWHVAVATDPAVNGGWQLVPVEPTPEMCNQGAQAIVQWENSSVWPDSWGRTAANQYRKDCLKAYTAMLAVAPKEPT